MNNLMVLKAVYGVNIDGCLMEHLQKDIVKQKETGVVILPWFLTPVVVQEDTEIKILGKEESVDYLPQYEGEWVVDKKGDKE